MQSRVTHIFYFYESKRSRFNFLIFQWLSPYGTREPTFNFLLDTRKTSTTEKLMDRGVSLIRFFFFITKLRKKKKKKILFFSSNGHRCKKLLWLRFVMRFTDSNWRSRQRNFRVFFFTASPSRPHPTPFLKKTNKNFPSPQKNKKNVPYSYIIGLGYLIGSLLLLVEAGGTL